MLEAGPIARTAASPTVLTYHCDVSLPSGFINGLQRQAIDASSRLAMRAARQVVVTSQDYAQHSRLSRSIVEKLTTIPPPCHEYPAGEPTFRRTEGLHVGFLGRIVEEKGLEFLVEAFRRLRDPDARLLIGGEFSKVAGQSVVQRVREQIGDDSRIELLGFIEADRLADFYASIDIFALPSINAFEAFGIVQVEAMMAGVPVVASDLPGVRVPVKETGMGEIAVPTDADSIEKAIHRLRDAPPDSTQGRTKAIELYSAESVIERYDELFDSFPSGIVPTR